MEKNPYILPDEDVDWVSEMEFEDLQAEAHEWLEAAGITSAQQIAALRREGLWTHPDYKRSTPDSWDLVKRRSRTTG